MMGSVPAEVSIDVAAVRAAYGGAERPRLVCRCKSRLFYLQPDLFSQKTIPVCADCGTPQPA